MQCCKCGRDIFTDTPKQCDEYWSKKCAWMGSIWPGTGAANQYAQHSASGTRRVPRVDYKDSPPNQSGRICPPLHCIHKS